MTNLDIILKSRDLTLPTKVHLVKAMVFLVVMHGCESLTVKKAKHWRIDTFDLWCWRRLLRVPWTARRSNQSILKISPRCSLEGLMLKLKTPILWPPDAKSWLIWKDSDAGRDWGQEEKGMTEDEMAGWHHRLDGHEFGWTPGVGDGQGGLVCFSPWGCKEPDMTERLNWILQYFEKYSSTVQQLAHRGCHHVNRQKELLTGRGREGGRWYSRLSAVGDGGQAATSLTPDWMVQVLVPWWI